MKRILLFFGLAISVFADAQYTAVRAKYTDTRLVEKPGFPDTRENRLVLSFYNVDYDGNWTPISMTNYDMYVKAGAVQVAGWYAIDSTGSNYSGYNFTAPVVASYFNTLGPQYFDCGTYGSIHLVANGHELDCGFLTVSEWLLDYDDNQYEQFNTIEVALPYYWYPNPLATYPGNLNFGPAGTAGMYNYYNFSCGGSLQLVNRGAMAGDSMNNIVTLPVRFANLAGRINSDSVATISWSNLSESEISSYLVERSTTGYDFHVIGTVLPRGNAGTREDYQFQTTQSEAQVYYRIKAIENDGRTFYSTVIALKRNGPDTEPGANKIALSVFPNPVQGTECSFRLTNAEKGRYISFVVNAEGKQLRQKMVVHNGGDLTRTVDLTGLPAGIYQFVLRGEKQKYSQKIIYVR